MKIRTFLNKDYGAYVKVYRPKNEPWLFDLNFFDGDRTEEELSSLITLLQNALAYAKSKE
jgi:hypothetical protein